MARYDRRTTAEAERAQLELLAELFQQGINIGEQNVARLITAGLIRSEEKDATVSLGNGDTVRISMSELQLATVNVSPKHTTADRHVTIVYVDKQKQPAFAAPERTVTERLFKKEIAAAAVFCGEEMEVTVEMWQPKSKINHTPEFVAWIDSINRVDGFWNSTHYKPFELYCRQAEQWLAEPTPDFLNDSDLLEWQIRENERCAENSLYACDKYGHLKEATAEGMHRYVAAKAHKVLLYLLDCGYSLDIAKARQIAFTTTICLWVLLKAMFRFNFNAKYISEDKIKAEDALENKIKYPYSMFPTWLAPEARNDRGQRFVFGEKGEKGERAGNNSGVEVLPPSKTAITSGTPDITLIDEAGKIDVLNSLLSDNTPTQYGVSTKTGTLQLLRQLVIWGTGGEMKKGGVAFMAIYMAHWKAWSQRKFSSGMIPLFFNNWWKPGMTRELYEQLKEEAYAKEGPTREDGIIEFHQNFPITLEDVFLVSGKTLFGQEFISKNMDRIDREGEKAAPEYGFFEPVYDTTSPAHEGSDVPFKIKEAKWVSCRLGDNRVTTMIWSHPKKWRNRYYQGTDPIASDNGHSKMASCIWDAYFAAPVALLNYRTDNYKQVFLQCVLLGMYYGVEEPAAPELIEANNGTTYREYKDNKGLGNSLVFGSELEPALQTKSVLVGVDNKGHRNARIIDTMHSIFESFGERIWLSVFFTQLKTFVCKPKGNGQTWEPMDKRYNWDDALFALTYSYICACCYTSRRPENLVGTEAQEKKVVKYVAIRDRSGVMKKIPKQALEKIRKRNALLSH